MKLSYFTIARPYAIAAFYFASQDNKITEWQNMISLITKISQDSQFLRVFHSCYFPSDEIFNLLVGISKNTFSNFQQNFIKIIIENSRLLILPYILRYFLLLKNIQKNIVNIEIISAYKLHNTQLERITNKMEKKLSKRVKFKCKIDKTIIAGIIIKIENSVINGSVKRCLTCFEQTLKN